MLIEDLILVVIFLIGIGFICLPLYALFQKAFGKLTYNPIKQAEKSLQKARVEVEVAKLQKETEALYHAIYEEALKEEEKKK